MPSFDDNENRTVDLLYAVYICRVCGRQFRGEGSTPTCPREHPSTDGEQVAPEDFARAMGNLGSPTWCQRCSGTGRIGRTRCGVCNGTGDITGVRPGRARGKG